MSNRYRVFWIAEEMPIYQKAILAMFHVFIGIALILVFFGYLALLNPVLELPKPALIFLDWVGATLTTSGTVVVVITIYLPPNERPPNKLSRLYTGPAVI